jgi:hypothetical protein
VVKRRDLTYSNILSPLMRSGGKQAMEGVAVGAEGALGLIA